MLLLLWLVEETMITLRLFAVVVVDVVEVVADIVVAVAEFLLLDCTMLLL